MTVYYVRTAGGNANAAGTYSLTSGGGATGAVPTNADDVILDGASGPFTVTAAMVCRSLVQTPLYTSTMTVNTSIVVSIGHSTAAPANLALELSAAATMTYGNSASGFTMNSTSTAQQTVTSNGKSLGAVIIAGVGSSYVLGSTTVWASFLLSAGAFDTGNYNISGASLNYGNANARTLTLGSSIITLSAASSAFTGSATTNLTMTANTATIVINGTIVSLNNAMLLGSFNWNGLSFTIQAGTAYSVSTNGATIANLTITGTATQAEMARISGALTITGTWTVNGNSHINRPLVWGQNLGAGPTVTAAAVSFTNVDFRDITLAGAAAGSGGTNIGNCGGNSGITFTTAVPTTRNSTPGAWSSTGSWSGGRVPLPQDDVTFDGSSANTTVDVQCWGRNMDFSAYTGTLTRTSTSNAITFFGNMILSSSMNMGVAPNTWNMEARGRGAHTITSNGNSFFPATSNQRLDIIAPGGGYTLTDAIICRTTSNSFAAQLVCQAGYLVTGPYNHTVGTINGAANSYARTMTLNNSTFDMYATSAATIMNMNATLLTLSDTGATYNITGVSASTRTWAGAGLSYGTVNFNTGLSQGTLSITGSNTFAGLNTSPGRQVTVTSNTTQTITSLTGTQSAFGYQTFLGNGATSTISSPDAAPIRFTSSFTVDVKMSPGLTGAWAGNSTQCLVSKANSAVTQGWYLRFASDGRITLMANGVSASSSAAIGTQIADGVVGWVRAVWNDTTNQAFFYTSPDGSTWTQLGTTQTLSSAGIVDAGTVLRIGEREAANDNFLGKIYQVRLYSDATQSTLAFHANFETKTLGADSFTESSSNAATVTITGYKQFGDGRIDLRGVTPGTQWNLAKGGPGVFADVSMKVTDTRAIDPYVFFNPNGIDGGNNTNITFASKPLAPLRRQHATLNQATGTSNTTLFAYPVVAGNLLVAGLRVAGVTGTVNVPTGWTLAIDRVQGSQVYVAMYYKIADGTETGVVTSWANTNNNTVDLYEIYNFVGVPTLDVTDSNSSTSATTLSTGSGVSNTAQPAIAFAFLAGNGGMGNTTTPPTNDFQEDYTVTGSGATTKPALKPLTTLASESTTFNWTTSRTPNAVLGIFTDIGVVSTTRPSTLLMLGVG